MALNFELIVGTYEQFLLGYKVHNVDNVYSMEQSFATHNHLGSIRTVASGRHYLASGGTDDSIFLYDMRYRTESGRLTHHAGTVNCMAFTPEASHLLTASSDGSIGVVRCGNWQLEKHWTAPHKGSSVNALAIHPTGKLAMSAGGDGVLRTWNLVKGRQAYATNLVPRMRFEAKNVAIIRWSPDGEKYLLVSNCKIDVYSVATAGLCAEISFPSRVVCVEFMTDNTIAVGHDDGKIRVHDLVAGADTLEIDAHDMRVKCLAHRDNYLASASSSGEIKLWRYGKKKLNMLSRATCGARITCITLTHPCPDLTVKKEEYKAAEEVPLKKKVFRMRQEVIVENEGDDDVSNITQSKTKAKKKAGGRKRPVEVTLETAETTEAPKKKSKKKKLPVSEAASTKSPMEKKRPRSVTKTVDSPKKKLKKEIVQMSTTNEAAPASQSGKFHVEDEATAGKKRKKKKQKKVVASIEKPSKPVPMKRKQQNVTSSTTGFPTKTKKKKLSR